MDWTAGYASDVEYTAGFYREQSPVYLNFVAVLNGFEPVDLDRPFTYFELGFGRGLTANLIAATNPNGAFYAADFNPAHVAGARQLADAAELKNLTLLENSFEELASGEVAGLPQFDFITLHGIYTWVTAENRRHIADFIARYLKPGGIVYMSYNAMPGWSAALPLQRLLVEHGDLYPNRSDVQIQQAGKFVEQLNELQAGYFGLNSIALKPRLETLKTGNPNYLVHEYMHKHWEPMYHADVARDMTPAKLDYVGSADLLNAYPVLSLTAAKLELLNGISDMTMRETVKDYFFNTGFRKDVFVRGARRMSPARQTEFLRNVGLALLIPRADVNLTMKLSVGEVNAKPEIYAPILDVLADGPRTLGELNAMPSIGKSFKDLEQIAAILTASGQATIYFASDVQKAGESARKMNRALAEATRFGDDYQALASPLLGNGITVNYIERLVFLAISQKPGELDAAQISRDTWKIMVGHGRRLIKDGKALETTEESLAELNARVQMILTRVPFWRQLNLL